MKTYQFEQRFIEIDGEQIAVTEEVYRAYKRPVWNENKDRERESRCRTANGTRCTEKCWLCNKERTGKPLSLEQFVNDGFEVPDYVDPLDDFIDKELVEELYAALDELEPENLQIIEFLFFDKLTERQTAERIGFSQKGINKRKAKIIEQLKKYFKVS